MHIQLFHSMGKKVILLRCNQPDLQMATERGSFMAAGSFYPRLRVTSVEVYIVIN